MISYKKLKSATRSNPKLWEKIKKQVLKGSKGGAPNKWSARKAQLAVSKYKSAGGKYVGKKSKYNSLTKWSKEKWGYVGGKGSNPKQYKGRYLPEIVRKNLTKKEKEIENKRKGSKRGKWVSYSPSVTKKMRKYKIV